MVAATTTVQSLSLAVVHGLSLRLQPMVQSTLRSTAAAKSQSRHLLRALGHSKTSEIKALFEDVDTGEIRYIEATLEKDTARGSNEALIEVYRRLRPGDLATVDNARQMIERMFFDFKRFDYSRVGRYKLNQRLGIDVANTTENRTYSR